MVAGIIIKDPGRKKRIYRKREFSSVAIKFDKQQWRSGEAGQKCKTGLAASLGRVWGGPLGHPPTPALLGGKRLIAFSLEKVIEQVSLLREAVELRIDLDNCLHLVYWFSFPFLTETHPQTYKMEIKGS